MHVIQVKNGDFIGVTLSGVSKPTTYDAVAVYIQDPSDSAVGLNKLLKYKWANADLSYVSTGSTTFRSGLQLPLMWTWLFGLTRIRHQFNVIAGLCRLSVRAWFTYAYST